MSRLIIHIGTHKTGTTTIQRTLAKARKRLRERGIWYPSYSEFGLGEHYAHLGMANALAGDHSKYTPEDAERFFTEVVAGANDIDTTFISAEPFYRQVLGDMQPKDAPDASAYWQMRMAYISRLRELIGDAEIALVLRERAAFAESLYQEHVKVTRYTGTFQEFLNDFWFHFDYAGQISAWRQHFPVIHVLPYSEISGPNIAKRLLNRLDLKPGRLHPVENQNSSLPHDGIILKRAYNAIIQDREELANVSDALASQPFLSAVQPGKRSFFHDATAKQKFVSQFALGDANLEELAFLGEPTDMTNRMNAEIRYGDTLTEQEVQRLVGVLGDSTSGEVSLPDIGAAAHG